MKIAVVGGASTYTPELVDGIARLGLPVSELALIDPAAQRLAVVGGFSARIFGRYGGSGLVTWTSTLAEGLDGADVVLIQLRVGGQAARISDETFPLEFGRIGQETTGAGGLAKAMRTVPVVLDIAEQVRRLAKPDAWIINFTNPVGIMTRALLDAGHRAIGLCNVAIGFQRRFAAELGVQPEQVRLDHVGLNHLTWERGVRVNGVDHLPEMLDKHVEELAAGVVLPPAILLSQQAIPSYYLRYFYCHDEVVAEERGTPTRGQAVADIERQLLEIYADPTQDTKPELLGKRGGAFYSEAAVGLLRSLYGEPGYHSVNVRNRGTFPFLPDDAVIEVCADVDATGPHPAPAGYLDPAIRGLIAHVSAYEELALEAALHGGRERVYRALLAHPTTGQGDVAAGLADRLLAANKAFLP
ncbi:6-phospho-beta-glucosidase [Hamadaea tsunoensis]|uniref:6-phospho-beta-glucosidase n=1 Tax=Hamadaea tsunoensis TaxID=53368 RepID=UPI00048A02B5|nr:6-phospho-beta-glucosidase [Hamadaea tsunoensis]